VAQGHQGIDGQHALREHNGGDRHKRFADGQGGAAFGRVVEGLDVIRKIQQQPVKGQILSRNEPSDKPGTIQLSRIRVRTHRRGRRYGGEHDRDNTGRQPDDHGGDSTDSIR
jgi:cyclophilin family peptidyl-prolyl cis-trans isomerase